MMGEIGIVGREPMAASRFPLSGRVQETDFGSRLSAAIIRCQNNSRNLKMHSPKGQAYLGPLGHNRSRFQ